MKLSHLEKKFLKKFFKYYIINITLLEQGDEVTDEEKETIDDMLISLESEEWNNILDEMVEGTNLGVAGNLSKAVPQAGHSLGEGAFHRVSDTTVHAPANTAQTAQLAGSGGGKIKTTKKKKRRN